MWKPNKRQRTSMARAQQRFADAMSPQCLSYLAERGISPETAQRFGLGVVPDGVKGYEQYYGRMAIPYVDRTGVYGYKFRCMAHSDCKSEDCAKYLNPPGQELGLYNVLALDSDSDTLHICEGEIDTVVLSQIVPDPVIGLPGAKLWRDHYPFHLAGFERVCVWPDGDKAGLEMGEKWAEKCRQVEVMRLPTGCDVNSIFLREGPQYFTALLDEDTGDD